MEEFKTDPGAVLHSVPGSGSQRTRGTWFRTVSRGHVQGVRTVLYRTFLNWPGKTARQNRPTCGGA